ncbi:MAG: MotA/TolQ/ExbB proton channel family protein [Planctomycetes bacterium]|nr:MotA/TolQ/ExbB proton channel family protein [Planctomycetota bacterium]
MASEEVKPWRASSESARGLTTPSCAPRQQHSRRHDPGRRVRRLVHAHGQRRAHPVLGRAFRHPRLRRNACRDPDALHVQGHEGAGAHRDSHVPPSPRGTGRGDRTDHPLRAGGAEGRDHRARVRVARELDDPFFAKGIQTVVDGYAPEMVRTIMSMEIDATRGRHAHGKKILEMFASFAPAFGMIGTLVGLVQMLSSLSDPSQIGGGMAVALLTTLYGALIANMVCLPLAGKLDIRAKQEANVRAMIVEGLLSIQSGEKPAIIREKLLTFIPPKDRKAA